MLLLPPTLSLSAGLALLTALSLLTGLPVLATLPTLALLARPSGPLLSAPALAATVLLASAAFISLRLACFATVLEVRFGTRVRLEAALIAVLAVSLRSSLAAALGPHRGSALALALLVALTPASALALIRLRSGPALHARLTGRLRSLFGPPRASRFLASILLVLILILLPGSLAPHFTASARRALEPAAIAVALALVLVALATLILLAPLFVVPVRSVLP